MLRPKEEGCRDQVLRLGTWNTAPLSGHILRCIISAGFGVLILTEAHGVPPSFELIQREFPGRDVIRSCMRAGDDTDGAAVTVIILSKRASSLTLTSGTRTNNARMAWVRLNGIYNLTIIGSFGTYVPHVTKWRAPFQGGYLQGLESSVRNLRERFPRDCQILAGDVNVKLTRNVEKITGRFSMHAKY